MPSTLEQPSSNTAGVDAPILRCQGIRRVFRNGQAESEVLRHVDLTVKAGEFIAIEGRSGSGKSTLLHILGTLDAADEGSVEFEGLNLSEIGGKERCKVRNTQFGFVFQFYHLLPELNVLENTLLAPMIELSWLTFRSRRAELKERAVALLESLGLGHRMKHKVTVLSGGERQRVAIARALMNTPKILFADEPTGNLDFETGQQIMGVFEKLHGEKGQTVVLVTHDRALARQADRVLVLKDGKLEKPVVAGA